MRSALVSVLAAASLVIAPTAAIAASPPSASKLSLRNAPQAQEVRAGAEMRDPNALGGSLMLIGAVAVAVVIGLIIILDDDDEEPTSP